MSAKRIKSILITFFPCFIFWLLLTMSLQPTELLMGLVVCLITAWFSSGFFVQNEEGAVKIFDLRRAGLLIYYLFVVFFKEVIKSNWAMAKTVFLNKPIKQAIVKVPVHGITSYYGLALLADCITLTPGTITVDVLKEGDDYSMYVQWIIMESEDPEEAGEIIKGTMEKWIGRIFG